MPLSSLCSFLSLRGNHYPEFMLIITLFLVLPHIFVSLNYVWISFLLVFELYTNGIILYTLFCDLLFPHNSILESIHFHCCVYLFIALLVDSGDCFCFLGLTNSVDMNKSFSWLHAQEWNCWVIRYAHLQPHQLTSNCFQKWTGQLTFPPAV